MPTGLGELISLEKAHIKPASHMLARAFRDDPIDDYAYPDAAEKARKLPHMYEFLLRYYLRYAQTYATSSRLEGIAVWVRLEKVASISFWRIILSGALLPALKMGVKCSRRMQPFFEYVDGKHKALVPFPHWYLMLLGVDPEFQGQGYASRLLRGMFPGIDEDGLPCYLETETERNVSLYQHLGFRVLDEFIVPGTTVKFWAMLRESQAV